MGADFLVAFVSVPKGTDPDWLAGEAYIESLRGKPLGDWDEEYVANYMDELDDECSAEEVAFVKNREANNLLEDLTEIRRVWEGGFRRDATILEIGDQTVLLTGGMSWGDSPTDLAEMIWKQDQAGVSRHTFKEV
jgi:hypothetical protein